jgi:hypothetical protein
VPVCQRTHSVALPLERTLARLDGRSRSTMSRPKISLARAALSYSSRHNVFSRRAKSGRRHRDSTCRRVRARVRSGCSRRRSRLAAGSALNQPRFDHHATAERNVASSRFQVAGGVPVTASEPGRERHGLQLPEGGPGTNAQRESGEGRAVDRATEKGQWPVLSLSTGPGGNDGFNLPRRNCVNSGSMRPR